MEQPKPADGWPDGPLSEAEAEALLDDDGLAVWVMDAESAVRSEMYSYSGGRWMDYGTQRKDNEDAPPMAGTLESYRILTGESDLDLG